MPIARGARSLSRSLFLPLSLSRDVRFAEETVSWRLQEQYMQQLPWSSGRAPVIIRRRSPVRSRQEGILRDSLTLSRPLLIARFGVEVVAPFNIVSGKLE